MALVLGADCVLNRNTGSYGSPTWDPVTTVRDLTLNAEMSESEATTRGSGKFNQFVPALCPISVEGQFNWDYADSDFAAFNTAFRGRALIDCQVFDSGGKGIRAEFHVFQFPRSEPLNGQCTVDFELKPGYSANAPTWV